MTIKLLLLAGVVLAALFAYRGAPTASSLATRRLALGATLAAAGVAIVAPDLVTAVANAVGVGRGTDLVLYVFVLAAMFIWIGLYRRLHELEGRYAELVRSIALDRAEPLEQQVPLSGGSRTARSAGSADGQG
jgi:hypothetical protein